MNIGATIGTLGNMFSSAKIRGGLSERGAPQATVSDLPGWPGWQFIVKLVSDRGERFAQVTESVPPEDFRASTPAPPEYVRKRIEWLLSCWWGCGDFDPTMAHAASAMANPKWADQHFRAAATAVIVEMEYERSAMARQLGHAFGDDRVADRPRPRAALAKAFDIGFASAWNERGEEVVDESRPGKTVDSYLQLAKTLPRPDTGKTYLPKNLDELKQKLVPETPSAEHGPYTGREITLSCWRTPYEGEPIPGEHVIGPDVVVEADWSDLRSHFEDREQLGPIEPLRAVPPQEVPQRLRLIIRDLKQRYPGAAVTAVHTESRPDA